VRTDMIFGASATVLLVVGMLRVAYFEKGPAYYWHDLYFLIKLGAFVLAALISIYPTLTFLAWGKSLKAGTAPEVPEARTRSVRMCMMLELTGILVILACAALMARGFGFLS
jgi:putative membrane protein